MTLTDTAVRLLADLPAYERDSSTIQRVMDAMARELDRVDAAVAAVQAEALPSTADVVLWVWEQLFSLPITPVGKSLAQRRAAVLAYLSALGSSGSGQDWEAAMNALIGTGWTYLEYAPAAQRQSNEVTDPRGVHSTYWSASAGVTITAVTDSDLGGKGLEVTIPAGLGPITFALSPNEGVMPMSDDVAQGDFYGHRMRVKIVQPFPAGTGFLDLNAINRFVGGGDSGVQVDAVNPTTLAAGSIVDLVGINQVTISNSDGIGLGLSCVTVPNSATPIVFRIGRMLTTKVAGFTSTVPAYFDGNVDGYEWDSTIDASVSRAESPPAYTIRIYLPFTPALVAPTTPTGTPSGGGGPTYSWVVTATNSYGETLPSPTRTTNLPAGGNVTLDWPDVTGATGYRVYRSTGSGPLQLVAEPTVSTYVDHGNAPLSTMTPPTVNTTQSPSASDAETLARAVTPANTDLDVRYGHGFIMGVNAMGDTL